MASTHANAACEILLCAAKSYRLTSWNCQILRTPLSNNCSMDHKCTTECKESCRQVCVHTKCKKPCGTPCAVSSTDHHIFNVYTLTPTQPCQARCAWACRHYRCPVPCGSVCARLPCDERCENTLSCGHRCPSGTCFRQLQKSYADNVWPVCGEPCNSQICPLCASDEEKSVVVDQILWRTLGDIDPDGCILDEMLITLPNCGHVFTVSRSSTNNRNSVLIKNDVSGRDT